MSSIEFSTDSLRVNYQKRYLDLLMIRVDNNSDIIIHTRLLCFIRAIVYLIGAWLWGLLPPRALRARVLDIERGPASIATLRRRRYTSSTVTPRSPRPPWLGLEQSRGDVHNSRAVPAGLRFALLHRYGRFERAGETDGAAEKGKKRRVRQLRRWCRKCLSPGKTHPGNLSRLWQDWDSAIKFS